MAEEKLNLMWKLLLMGVSILLLADTGCALSCYQCNSTLESNCQDMFDHSLQDHPQKSTDCNMYQARHCIKVTGLWGGIVGTHRFCSSRDLGDQCQDIGYLDHDRMYRACIYTCSNDGCNGSTQFTISATLSVTIGLLYLAMKTL